MNCCFTGGETEEKINLLSIESKEREKILKEEILCKGRQIKNKKTKEFVKYYKRKSRIK
jgi:hypothetical protein